MIISEYFYEDVDFGAVWSMEIGRSWSLTLIMYRD